MPQVYKRRSIYFVGLCAAVELPQAIGQNKFNKYACGCRTNLAGSAVDGIEG